LTCDYGRTYGKVAADQIDGHGQWLSIREDTLLPLVEKFIADRIFGPMPLDKLEKQLRTHQKTAKKQTDALQRELRDRIADLDRRIGLQIDALETGIEPQLVGQRIADLREAKEEAEIELHALTPSAVDSVDDEDPAALLARIPNLTTALQGASCDIKRQVFDAFGLQIAYDKVGRNVDISATISEAVASALEPGPHIPRCLPVGASVEGRGRVTQKLRSGSSSATPRDKRHAA
jgi:hypothetical protein